MTRAKNESARTTIKVSRDVKNRLDELAIERNINTMNGLILDLLIEIDE